VAKEDLSAILNLTVLGFRKWRNKRKKASIM